MKKLLKNLLTTVVIIGVTATLAACDNQHGFAGLQGPTPSSGGASGNPSSGAGQTCTVMLRFTATFQDVTYPRVDETFLFITDDTVMDTVGNTCPFSIWSQISGFEIAVGRAVGVEPAPTTDGVGTPVDLFGLAFDSARFADESATTVSPDEINFSVSVDEKPYTFNQNCFISAPIFNGNLVKLPPIAAVDGGAYPDTWQLTMTMPLRIRHATDTTACTGMLRNHDGSNVIF